MHHLVRPSQRGTDRRRWRPCHCLVAVWSSGGLSAVRWPVQPACWCTARTAAATTDHRRDEQTWTDLSDDNHTAIFLHWVTSLFGLVFRLSKRLIQKVKSPTVLWGHSGNSKQKRTSLWSIFPNSGRTKIAPRHVNHSQVNHTQRPVLCTTQWSTGHDASHHAYISCWALWKSIFTKSQSPLVDDLLWNCWGLVD